jgi:glycosyltransferase involved in cell wall biosynthesis
MLGEGGKVEFPVVSVVMPSFNHERYVEQAVQSVLMQDGISIELIVVDNASSDSTYEKLMLFNDPRITIVRYEKNTGCSGASNKAFSLAKGKYIGWLASDDFYEPNCLKVLVEALRTNLDCSLVVGRSRIVDESGLEHEGLSWHDIYLSANRELMLQNMFYGQIPFCTTATLLRRELIDQVGGFVDEYKQIDDLAFWIKVLFSNKLCRTQDVVVNYRWSSENLNSSGVTNSNINRQSVEMVSMLKSFRSMLHTLAEFEAIFPDYEFRNEPDATERVTLDFHLAQLCLQAGSAAHRFVGLEILYSLFAKSENRIILEQKYDFGIQELFRAAGEEQIFVQPRQIEAEGIVLKFLDLAKQLNSSKPYQFWANLFKSIGYPAGTRFFHLLDINRNGHNVFAMEQALKIHQVFPCKKTSKEE